MKPRSRTVFFAAALVAAILQPKRGYAQFAVPAPCSDGTLPSGALSRMCVPSAGWNGALVVFAHGYVSAVPPEPIAFHNLTLPDGTDVPTLVHLLGFAFATTSYRQNGLAILEGVEDTRQLVLAFGAAYGAPKKTYLTGGSEGGLVATLLAEQSPGLLTSALAACGPIGSFKSQIDYFGDFRVLFDYYFPNILPSSAVNIPPVLIQDWEKVYAPAVAAALAANPARAVELLRVANAAFDAARPETIIDTALGVLQYNVFGTGDAMMKLGGNPYGNASRWYFGSSNDFLLNFTVPRFTASPAAIEELRKYETHGNLRIPLVTIHTIGDPIIPIWHELAYFAKLDSFGHTQFAAWPVARYGHCTFMTWEVLGAFLLTLR